MSRSPQYLLLMAITICLLGMASCRPRGVLSPHEMRDVMYDLHRADGAIQVAGYNYSHDEELAACYKSVLDKHGITQAQFDSSLVWYTDNPQRFNKIYPKVVARLEADLQAEQDLRDAIRHESTLTPIQDVRLDTPCFAPLSDIQHTYIYGYANPWSIWKPSEYNGNDIFVFSRDSVVTEMNYDNGDI